MKKSTYKKVAKVKVNARPKPKVTPDSDADKSGTDADADKTGKRKGPGKFDKPDREIHPDQPGIDSDRT